MSSNQIPFDPSSLGAGYKGKQPMAFGHAESGANRALYRKHLAKAFGNLHISGLGSSPSLYNKNVLGPFKTAFNSGDVISTNYGPASSKYGNIPNQVGGNNLSRVNPTHDGKSTNGTNMYSGNPKYVHDGSDYIRFKKLQAVNRNYNDSSYGGSQNSQQRIAIWRVRK